MASIWTSAAQAAQQGFDESYYLGQKAALLTTQTGTTWTVDMVKASFASAGLQAYEHYQEYGFKEGLNPNSYFNNSYYDSSKATASGITESAFQTAWNNVNGGSQTSTYFHYLQYGYNESGVNPSATFNEAQYYTDKAALLTAQTGQTWTVAQVQSAFASAGLTPITHYMLYGGTPNEPTPVPVNNVGTTYTLTTGLDTIPGTVNNDTINAGEVGGAKTLTAGDNIDGAGGTNTINVFDTAVAATTYAGFTMQNVQILNATSDGAGMTFDLSGTTGLTNINSVNSTNNVTANYVASPANVGITNATAAANMTVGYQNVGGTADTIALTLNNSSAGIVKLGAQGTNTGIETLAVTATGAASTITTLDSAITAMTLAGDQHLTITNDLNASVQTIDASASTGGLTAQIGTVLAHTNDVTFTGSSAADAFTVGAFTTGAVTFNGGDGNDTLTVSAANVVTFNGGAGDDTITFVAGGLTTADTVIGGTGNDSLTATYADLALVNAGATQHVSQVETINLSTNMAGAFNGKAWFADATTFNLNAGYTGGTAITIDSATQAVNIGGGVNAGILNVVDSATSATNDSVHLGINGATTATVAFSTGELETVNLTSGTDSTIGGKNTLTLNDAAATNVGLNNVTTITVTGNEALDLTVSPIAAGSKIVTLDASTATGDIHTTTAAGVSTVDFKAGTALTITTGSGSDWVTGGTVADTINVGTGVDTVWATTGTDSINLGADTAIDHVRYNGLTLAAVQAMSNTVAGVQTITNFVSGTDVIDIENGGATLLTTFQGNGADYAASLAKLTGIAGQAVYEQDTNILWVDADGDGNLNGSDIAIKLTGVSSLVAADVGL